MNKKGMIFSAGASQEQTGIEKASKFDWNPLKSSGFEHRDRCGSWREYEKPLIFGWNPLTSGNFERQGRSGPAGDRKSFEFWLKSYEKVPILSAGAGRERLGMEKASIFNWNPFKKKRLWVLGHVGSGRGQKKLRFFVEILLKIAILSVGACQKRPKIEKASIFRWNPFQIE